MKRQRNKTLAILFTSTYDKSFAKSMQRAIVNFAYS